MADDVVYPWGNINTITQMVSGVPIYFQIRPPGDRFYDVLRFGIYGSIAMTNFHVSVFRPSATPNVLDEVMHLGDVKSQLVTPPTLQTVLLSEPLDAVVGDIFYVGLLSVGGTAPYWYGSSGSDGIACAPYSFTTGQWPEYNQLTAKSTATGKTSFAGTETISSSEAVNVTTRIWGALGNLITTPVRSPWFFVDSLNRGNATDLISPWGGHPNVPRFAVYNQTASPQAHASLGAFNYVIPAARSDNHYIQARLGSDMDSALGKDIDLYLGVRGPRGVTGPATKLHINPDGTFRIVNVTRTYDNNGITERAAAPEPRVFQSGDVVKIVASDTIYTAFHNDDPITSWVDSGVIHPVGADQRWVDISAGQTLVDNLQTIDNIEAGDAVGGVQLVALDGVVSTGVVGSPTFQNDVTLTPAAAQLTLTGNAPVLIQGGGLTPATGVLTLTGNVGTVQVLTPTPEINTPHTGTAVPANAVGAWVTLRGAGGGGGGGRELDAAYARFGGGGGGGGAVIKRSWIPRSAMGETYSVEVGAGGVGGAAGNYGSPGGRARFVSGFVDWKANGGAGGFAGRTDTAPLDVAGGTVSVAGYTPVGGTENGAAGTGVQIGGIAFGAAGAGGGPGGYVSAGGAGGAGQDGGYTPYATAGDGTFSFSTAGGNSTDHVLGGGGGGGGGGGYPGNTNYAGGRGGDYGGGGGGSGACNTGSNHLGGTGGGAYARLEWLLST